MSDYIRDELSKLVVIEQRHYDSANKNSDEFRKQVVLLVAILFPVSTLLVSGSEGALEISDTGKRLLGVIWISFTVALTLSFVDLIIEKRFWMKHAKATGEVIEKVNELESSGAEASDAKNIEEIVKYIFKDITNKSITYLETFSLVFAVFGMAMLLLFLFTQYIL